MAMLPRNVRSIVAVMAALTLVFGAEWRSVAARTPRPARTGKSVVRTADLLDRSGNVRLHVEGDSYNPSALLAVVKQLRSDPATLIQWRASAEAYAKRSSRSVGTMLHVIDALAAPTRSEYHARVRQLGVDVSTSTAQDGTQTTSFSVKGAVKLRVVTSPSADSDERESGASGPFVAANEREATQEECDGGPCATEEEKADAISVALAIDDEATAFDNVVRTEWEAFQVWCDNHPVACSSSENLEAPQSGPSANEEPEFANQTKKCQIDFWNFVGATASTHSAVFGLVYVLLIPGAAPVLLVTSLSLAVVGGLAWMYSAAGQLDDCKRLMLQ